MRDDVELLVGLLDRDPACVGADEVDGLHGAAIGAWQDLGFVGRDPVPNPTPSCPHCGDGAPYRMGGRLLCNRCRSDVDPRHLILWPFDRGAFLVWVAEAMELRGSPRQLDPHLWQLGTLATGDDVVEFFYLRDRPSPAGAERLAAYRRTLIVFGLRPPAGADTLPGRRLSLLSLLEGGVPPRVRDPRAFLRGTGVVRFEPKSGALWAGDRLLGEVPAGTKEFFFLAALAAELDHVVSYADLKHEVLRRTGSTDSTAEATFCQLLKSRIKKKWIPDIDRVIRATHKADGYRLRGHMDASS